MVKHLLPFYLIGWSMQAIVNWPELANQQVVAQRSQRDVSSNLTIDQFGVMGANLNTVLFDSLGYVSATLANVTTLLGIGTQVLEVDLYWGERSQTWQLCPVAFETVNVTLTEAQVLGNHICEPSFLLRDLLHSIQSYLVTSNTNLSASIIQLILNLKPLRDDPGYSPVYSRYLQSSLSSVMLTSFKGFVYTPMDLEGFRENHTMATAPLGPPTNASHFPTWYQFIYESFDRILPIIRTNSLGGNSTYNLSADLDTFFIASEWFNVTYSSHSDSSPLSPSNESFRFVSDSNVNPFTPNTFLDAILNGYSPILNHTLDPLSNMALFINYSLWSWSEEELSGKTVFSGYASGEDADDYRCASLIESGWSVHICSTQLPAACRNLLDPLSWTLTEHVYTYADVHNSLCPTGFHFAVPRSALEQKALHEAIVSRSLAYPVWIDLNAIGGVDCWVTGGADARCPYQKVLSSGEYVRIVTGCGVVIFSVLMMMLCTRFQHIPVQNNRKHWKRIVAKVREEEVEGVPA